MKTFTVIVTRDITESCVVKVVAENRSIAEDTALDQETLNKAVWEVDDGSGDFEDPYVTGCDEETGEEKRPCQKPPTKESTMG